MYLWISPEGIDFLTKLIETAPSNWSGDKTRQEDLLGVLEYQGGGYTKEQLLSIMENRSIKEPLYGFSRKQYLNTLDNLVRKGYVLDL